MRCIDRLAIWQCCLSDRRCSVWAAQICRSSAGICRCCPTKLHTQCMCAMHRSMCTAKINTTENSHSHNRWQWSSQYNATINLVCHTYLDAIRFAQWPRNFRAEILEIDQFIHISHDLQCELGQDARNTLVTIERSEEFLWNHIKNVCFDWYAEN